MSGSLQEEMSDLLHESLHQDDSGPRGDSESGQTVVFANAYDFFHRWLRHMYRRRCGTPECKWRADWYECPEALARITELWRVWERSRLDKGDAMAVWWRDFCDPTMDRLMSPSGPFAESDTRCGYDEPLPCDIPAEGRFRDERKDEPFMVISDDDSGEDS